MNHRLHFRLFPWFVAALFLAVPGFGQVVLVDNGAPNATIVLADNPSPQAQEAAAVLRDYLAKISGATLPIQHEGEPVSGNRILVGRSAAVSALGIELPSGHTPQMNEECLVIKTVGNALVLAGNEDWNYRGTLFAVYDFLEQDLGCRWYFPGEYGEVLPDTRTIAVGPLDRVEHPSFRIRNLWYAGWMPASETDRAEFKQWYARNKLNGLSLSLPGDGSVIRLAPPDQYFESHPEIYALDKNGQRQKDMLCMSEPEAVRIGVETIKRAFREDPEVLSFGFAPPDGFPMCHCERCQRYYPGFSGKGYGDPSLTDLWFSFANKIAAEVYKEFPERWVLTNGYANRVRPPEIFASLSPNLGIQSAVIAACSIHRTGDPRCWQRSTYMQVLNRWTDALDCVFIYDYDPAKALENLPFPTLHCLEHDLPYFKERGIWGFWTEGSNSWMVTHLNYYVRAQLMWDVDARVEDLVHEYCQRFYKDAANPVEKYIWTLDKVVENSSTHETWGRLMQWRSILPPVREKLDRLMAKAEGAAQGEATQQRVHMLRLTHDHMMTFLDMEDAAAEGEFTKAVAHADRMLAIREEAESIHTGFIPRSSDIARDHTSSVEYHRATYQRFADCTGGAKGALVTMLPREWEFKPDPKDMGILYRWYLPDDEGGWTPIDVTTYWENQGWQDETGWGYWGKAWYRTRFEVPAAPLGTRYRLTVGGVYNIGVWVWVNGVMRPFEMTRHWRLGFQEDTAPFDVDVTDLIRPGETNHVAILVDTEIPGRNPRGGLHRRVFLWSPR
ncbi:MAG: DUF4838 domain-containing protein [Candidatus Hydrogenedentes bacterium]|nr:DUF4838 domain-containing protein [Candidatus Hydrogenedentota bacterium]